MITDAQIDAFQRDGAVMVKGLFADWVETIAGGIARNMSEPGEYASENAVTQGRFFDDYCNWTRIPEFRDVVENSPAAELAARAMRSETAQFFHDHVLVKEPGTPKPTPWHQDAPYYFVEGRQTVSLWIPIDPVEQASLRFIAGSHLWDRMVRPVSWADDSDFYDDKQEWTPVPDPDANPDDLTVLEWPMQPGDAVCLNDPFEGGTHLPDVTLVSPIFVAGDQRPRFYCANRAHHADVGGAHPGSMAPTPRGFHFWASSPERRRCSAPPRARVVSKPLGVIIIWSPSWRARMPSWPGSGRFSMRDSWCLMRVGS